MDNGFVRLSILGIFLPGYLRFSEIVTVVVVVFFFVKKGLLKSSVLTQNVPYITDYS